ncbi:MAG: metallophosphoesterase family protein [Proteobacteria bacterium]|nr:metallophosphoesterase family protein [Pseudomonadota bacterium]
MKIGVISDTHLKGYDERLKAIFQDHFSDVDLILHAGDLIDISVLDVFEGKEVKAVYGNMDPPEVRNLLPAKLVLDLNGCKVGLIHGWGMPFGMEKKLRKEFDDIDCLVYGHTHNAVNEVRDNILFFNPGSAIDRKFAARNTIGILEINDKITGKIIEIKR